MENNTQNAEAVLKMIASEDVSGLSDYLAGTPYANAGDDVANVVIYAASWASREAYDAGDATMRTLRRIATEPWRSLSWASALAENVSVIMDGQPQHEVIEDRHARLSYADADELASAEVTWKRTLPGYEI